MNDHIKDTIGKRLSGMEAAVPPDLFDRIQQNRSRSAIWLNWFRYRIYGMYTVPAAVLVIAGMIWGLGRTQPAGERLEMPGPVIGESYQVATLDDRYKSKRSIHAQKIEALVDASKEESTPVESNRSVGSNSIPSSTFGTESNQSGEALGSNQNNQDQNTLVVITGSASPWTKAEEEPQWTFRALQAKGTDIPWTSEEGNRITWENEGTEPDLPQPKQVDDLTFRPHRIEAGIGIGGNQWLFSGLDNRLMDARKTSEHVGWMTSGFVRYAHTVSPRLSWIAGVEVAKMEHRVFTDFSKVVEHTEIQEREVTVIDPPNPSKSQTVRDTIYTTENIDGEVSARYSVQTLQLPIGFRTYKNLGSLNIGFSGYAVPGFLRSIEGNVINAGFETVPAASGAYESQFTFGVGASAGIYGPLATRWSYFVEPAFNLTLTDHSGPFYPVATRRSSIGLKAGVSFSW
jgi:hypothetical protein